MMEKKNSRRWWAVVALLTVLLVAMKITDVISCSWAWVFAPLWIPFVISALIIVIGLVAIVSKGRDES